MSTCKVVRTRFVDPYWEILDESEKLIEIKPPKVTPHKSSVESMQVMKSKIKKTKDTSSVELINDNPLLDNLEDK